MGLLNYFRKKSPKKTCPVCHKQFGLKDRYCPKDGSTLIERVEAYSGFISYRRDGGNHMARNLKLMVENMSEHRLFLDVDELRSPGRFDDRLLRVIECCPTFILVLSPKCLERCVNEGDWLTREILHAISTERNIVPVMVESFEFPGKNSMERLPQEMRVLPNLQAVSYNYIHSDSSIRMLLQYMNQAATQPEILPGELREIDVPLIEDEQNDNLAQDAVSVSSHSPGEPRTLDIDRGATSAVSPSPADQSEKVVILELINFRVGQAGIEPGSVPVLQHIRRTLEQVPKSARICIDGHADTAEGYTEVDEPPLDLLKLSQDRALAVKRWLTDQGIDKERCDAVGFGDRMPIADKQTAAGRAKNRRVEFHVIE